MENKKMGKGESKTMKIAEAKGLSFEEFSKLDDAYSGFDVESSKNHPLRNEDETFMQFIKRGSEKIKSDPVIKKILE